MMNDSDHYHVGPVVGSSFLGQLDGEEQRWREIEVLRTGFH